MWLIHIVNGKAACGKMASAKWNPHNGALLLAAQKKPRDGKSNAAGSIVGGITKQSVQTLC